MFPVERLIGNRTGKKISSQTDPAASESKAAALRRLSGLISWTSLLNDATRRTSSTSTADGKRRREKPLDVFERG